MKTSELHCLEEKNKLHTTEKHNKDPEWWDFKIKQKKPKFKYKGDWLLK